MCWTHLQEYREATPISPLGIPIIIHNNPGTSKSWDYRGCKGFTIVLAFKYYRSFEVAHATTKATLFSDTIEVLHDYITQPEVMPEDRIVHTLNFLSCALIYAATTVDH